jgi:hypothetical protein
VSKTKIESPPLSEEEINDIKEFYANKKDHKIHNLDDLLDELHSD